MARPEGKSDAWVQKRIAQLISQRYDREQAIAIAFAEARRSRPSRSKGGRK